MADEPYTYSGKLAFLRRICVDSRLQRTAVAVAAVIVDHAHKGTGQTHVSVATIVSESGVPKSTALRALRSLEECGWIRAEKRFGTSSNYTLTGAMVGTGSGIGTGVIWNATGAIQNLRKGQTSPEAGAGPVPSSGHKQEEIKATGIEQKALDASRPVDLWADGIQLLTAAGTSREQAGQAIGKLRKELGEEEAVKVVTQMLEIRPTGPKAYLFGIINNHARKPLAGKLARDSRSEDEISAANAAALARFEARA